MAPCPPAEVVPAVLDVIRGRLRLKRRSLLIQPSPYVARESGHDRFGVCHQLVKPPAVIAPSDVCWLVFLKPIERGVVVIARALGFVLRAGRARSKARAIDQISELKPHL